MSGGSAFRHGFISGTSSHEPVAGLKLGLFDWGLFSATWDSRCVALTDVNDLKVETAVVVRLPGERSRTLPDQHLETLIGHFDEHAARVEHVDGGSLDMWKVWQAIDASFAAAVRAAGRELRVFIDVSATPRFHTLATLAAAVRRGRASEVVLVYVDGKYEEEGGDPGALFTSGKWEAVAIPLLAGHFDPNRPKHYVMSLGFEGSKTLRVVDNDNPDKLTVLLGDPGTSEGYVEKALEINEELIVRYNIGDTAMLRAPAGDPIGAWRVLAESAEQRRGDNVSYYCSGTKAHSVGLALAALSVGDAAVYYNKPGAYREPRTRSTGMAWVSRVIDHSAVHRPSGDG